MASAQAFVGDFQINTSTGNQSVTGVGFEPKALIFFVNPNTADIDSPDLTANHNFGIGMTDGTREFAMSHLSPNGATLEAGYMMQADDRCIIFITGASTRYGASIVSLDSDGFTINVDEAPGVGYQIGYLALGGDNLTNVRVDDFDTKSGTTGNQAYTGVGFKPDGLIAFSLGHSHAYSNSTIRADACLSTLGFTDGTNDRCVSNWLRAAGVIVGNRHCIQSNNAFLRMIEGDSPNYRAVATHSSFDADGFTLNFSVVDSVSLKVMYLAFKGPGVSVGDFTLPTSTGSFAAVSGLSFNPGMMLCASTGQPSMNSFSGNGDGSKLSIGAATLNSQRFCLGGTAEDNQSSPATDDDNFQHSQHLGRIGNFAQGTEEEFDFDTFNSDGFDLDAETALGSNPSKFIYIALEAGSFDPGEGGGGSGSGGESSKDASMFFSTFLQL